MIPSSLTTHQKSQTVSKGETKSNMQKIIIRMIYIQSKITMRVKETGKYKFIFLHNWEKNQTSETEITEMMELAHREVQTVVVNMFHMLRSIQNKHDEGKKVKELTVSLQNQETSAELNRKENHTEANHRLMAKN